MKNPWLKAVLKSLDEFEKQTAELHNTESVMFKKLLCVVNHFEAELFITEVQSMASDRMARWRETPEGQKAVKESAARREAAECNETACRALVTRWARAVGRTGRHSKQTRRGKLQKLIRQGVNSAYAREMISEIERASLWSPTHL